MTIRLNKSHQGSGKTEHLIKGLVTKIVAAGRKVMLAVPTTELARRAQVSLQDLNPLLLMSHEKHFQAGHREHECPHEVQIFIDKRNGSPTSEIKDKYCNACEFLPVCKYAHQYEQFSKRQVIICQHAHLTAIAIRNLITKYPPDLLIIDESPVDALLSVVKPTAEVKTAIAQYRAKYSGDAEIAKLERALDKKPTGREIQLGKRLRNRLIKFLSEIDCPDVMSEILQLIRLCNAGFPVTDGGIVSIFSLPQVPEILITDATANVEMLKIVTGQPLKVYESPGIFEPSKLNSGNKVLQVIDSTNSITATRGDSDGQGSFEYELLCEKLEIIAGLARTIYLGKQLLVTTYKETENKSREFMTRNFPDVMPSITFNHIESGTNRYENIDVQFLLCGVYSNDKQLTEEVWKLKSAFNYWAKVHGKPQIDNAPPGTLEENHILLKERRPLSRFESRDGHHASRYEYPQFQVMCSTDPIAKLIEEAYGAKTQQGIRVRFTEHCAKEVIIMGKQELPSFLISKSILLDDLRAMGKAPKAYGGGFSVK